MTQGTKIDLDGDGTPDATLTPIKKPAPKPSRATPKVVAGTEAPKVDVLNEFREQKAGKHYKINIPETGAPSEVKRIFVGVNGVPYTIQRGHDVIVPACVVSTLRDAKETRYRKAGVSPLGADIMEPYDVFSYPFQIIEEYDSDPNAA